MNGNSVYHWLVKVVDKYGPKAALTFLRHGKVETQLTYYDLLGDIHRFANALLDLGVRRGDRVVLFIPKSVVFVVAHFASQAIGAMSVPLNPGFKKKRWIIC